MRRDIKLEILKNGTRVATGGVMKIGLDALLLAAFSKVSGGTLLDLGAGCGIIGFWLKDRGFPGRITAVENDPAACGMMRISVLENGFRDVHVIECDLNAFHAGERFDAVIANPPYYSPDEGAVAPDPRRAAVRSDVSSSLHSVIAAAKRNLKQRGKLFLCYPANKREKLWSELCRAGFSVTRSRLCRHREETGAWLFLAEASLFTNGESMIESDFFVEKNGKETPEYCAAVKPGRMRGDKADG